MVSPSYTMGLFLTAPEHQEQTTDGSHQTALPLADADPAIRPAVV